MICMRVEYDAHHRTFKLIDQNLGPILEDGAVYELTLPLMLEEQDGEEELMTIAIGPMAHA